MEKKKRPCAREFGAVKFIISKDDRFMEIRFDGIIERVKIREHLGSYVTADIDKMILWLQKAKEYFR